MPPTSEGLAGGENRQLLSLESILPHLQGVRRLANGGYMARCPVHDDTNPSLSLREENGKLLWKCFAGCSQEAVQRELERRVGIRRETDRPTRRRTRLTLADYARQKGLDAEKLRAWGYYDHRQGVAMPERDITGKLINLKIRLPEGSKNRFFYPVYRYPNTCWAVEAARMERRRHYLPVRRRNRYVDPLARRYARAGHTRSQKVA
jgi:hypothetical protein